MRASFCKKILLNFSSSFFHLISKLLQHSSTLQIHFANFLIIFLITLSLFEYANIYIFTFFFFFFYFSFYFIFIFLLFFFILFLFFIFILQIFFFLFREKRFAASRKQNYMSFAARRVTDSFFSFFQQFFSKKTEPLQHPFFRKFFILCL